MFAKLKPHLIAIVAFLLVSSIYFSPSLSGKKMNAHDNVSAIAASKESMDYYKEKNEIILWTNRVFSGMPIFQINYITNSNFTAYYYKLVQGFSVEIAILFTIMLGFYLACVLMQLNTTTSTITSIAFALGTWFMLSIEAGHNSKMYAIGYVPLVFAGMYAMYYFNNYWGLLAMGVGMGLMIGTSHFQIVYYAGILCLAFGFFALLDHVLNKQISGFYKKTGMLLVFAVLGVLCNTTVMWTNYEYAKETMRGGQSALTKPKENKDTKSTGLDINYAYSWSYGIAESFNLLIPNYMGGGSNQELKTSDSEVGKRVQDQEFITLPTYWGDQPFTSGPTYLGIVVFLFFVFYLFVEEGKIKWMLLATGIFFLMLSWGRHFLILNEFLFNYLPVYNKFRTPSMALSITSFVTSIGAALFFSKLINQEYSTETLKVGGKKTAYVVGGLVVLAYLISMGSLDFKGASDAEILAQNKDFPISELIEDRKNMLIHDVYRALLLLAICGGIFWMYINQKLKNTTYLTVILSLLLIGDLWLVNKRYVNSRDYTESTNLEDFIPMTEADAQILNDKSYFRVFNPTINSFNDNVTGYYHANVGGYSAAKLYRYQDLIENQLSQQNMAAFNMLNTKYFIIEDRNSGKSQAQMNPDHCGNVWFVKDILWAKNADDEMFLMKSFNPKTSVIIDQQYKSDVQLPAFDSSGKIALSNYHPDKMEYTSNASSAQFAVFSEIWYNGNKDWKAYIDGKEAKMVRVNYLLRGLNIPAGKHDITFEFRPDCYYKGNMVGYGASVLLFVFSAILIYWTRNKKNNATEGSEAKA